MLFTVLYKMVLTLESVDKLVKCITIQTKATEQYFPVVLFINILYKVILFFQSAMIAQSSAGVRCATASVLNSMYRLSPP